MSDIKLIDEKIDKEGLKLCYERILYLTDLTVQSNSRKGFRKELLRWRDLAAEEYLSFFQDGEMEKPDPSRHLRILKSLLLFSPESANQIPYLI